MMIKPLFISALGIMLALGGGAPLQAQSNPIETWVDKVNRQVDRALASRFQEGEGEAIVFFRRASDGRAVDVEARAEDPATREAAVRTAKSLRDLPPLPAGVPADQRVTMRLLFRNDGDFLSFQQELDKLLASAKVANREFAQRTTDNKLAMLKGAH